MKKSLSVLVTLIVMSLVTLGQMAISTNPGGSRSLTGTYVEFYPAAGGVENYSPGSTQNLAFKAYSYSPDWEYVYNLWLQFPAGWVVNSVTVTGTPTCNIGSWGNFSFLLETPNLVNISHPRYMASGGDFCEAYYLVNATIPSSATGNAYVSWYWDGDGYGGAPHNPCSNDQFTPPSMAAQPCDEFVNARAVIPLDADLLGCPDGAVFSQPPVNPNNAYFSDESTTWSDQRIYENFSGLTNTIHGITFWGVKYDGGDCYTGGSDDFVINFYQDNAGAVGTLVQSFPVTIFPEPTGILNSGAALLKYHVNLPAGVTLGSGWIMLYRLNPANTVCAFAWSRTDTGDNLTGYSQGGGAIVYQTDNVALCLTSQVDLVPLSNWALFIGIGLILAFAVIRFRRFI